MRRSLTAILLISAIMCLVSWADVGSTVISAGTQPQVSTDSKGVIRVVFGSLDEIYCATSNDKGVSFSKPVFVAKVPDMHLGMSRGPQLASSANYSIITEIDKVGNIHWFKLWHSSGQWKNMGLINDLKGSAPEGLMSIAADNKDNFYAVWLDIRVDKNNQVYFSSLARNNTYWTKNLLAYQSPDAHVCECCKPNIAVNGKEIAIMFRNWLNGSRDLYMIKSANKGASFSAAQKLGDDTWKLNGCPMDGGGIIIDRSGAVQTTWQRKGVVYYCKPGQPELSMGKGRNSSISGTAGNMILTLQYNDTVKIIRLKNKSEIAVGNGGFMKSVTLNDNKILCVWEQNNTIRFKKM